MLMSALSSKARAVIEQAREEMRPAPGDRERLEALLDAQLGATAPIFTKSAPSPAPAPAPHLMSWRFVTSLTVGAALVGGGALLSVRPGLNQKPPPPPVTASVIVMPPDAPPMSPPAVEAQVPIAPELPRSVKPAIEPKAPAQASQDTLAQEVALLSRATSALRSGRAGAALRLLDEYQRKFPNGMLAVERQAVRAQTLCTLKRVAEGRAAIAQLAPQSPAAGRAKQLCDAAASSVQQ